MSLLQMISKGGPVMVVLLVLSVVALAVVLFKLYHFYKLQIWKDDSIDEVIAGLPHRGNGSALMQLRGIKNPVARVVESAVEGFADARMSTRDVEANVQRVANAEVRGMESMLRGLAAIAHLSPLLGLLGTVIGMISAFQRLEGAGMRVNPAILAGGIWEALLTTAFGLVIAIPAMAAYYFLEGEVDTTRARMKDLVTRIFIRYGVEGVAVEDQPELERVENYGV